MASKWSINIDNFLGGFTPAYFEDDYPTIGNKNMAGKMKNVDLTNPKYLSQGAGLSTLTNGDQTGVVSELIRGILDMAVKADETYAVGKTKLYKLSSTAVTSDENFPHTIAGATQGEDVAYYHGKIYYTWYDGTDGDIGELTLPSTFDDDWGSTTPTGHTSLNKDVPLPLLAAGNDFLYIGNKNYITSYDGNIFTEKDLDLPEDFVIQDLEWNLNRLFIAGNRPNVSGNNKNISSIYIWDGNAPSWEDEIPVKGEIKAIYVKNNILYVFWRDISGGSRLGILDGATVRDVALWDGSLPNYYQVTDYKNFITWVSDGLIYAWGARDKDLPAIFFQLADGEYANIGGLACPFGVPLVASSEDTSHKIAKFSGYNTNCYWKSLLFDTTGDERKSVIDEIIINFDTLKEGARADITLNYDEGTKSQTATISYTGDGATRQKKLTPNIKCESLRVEIDWSKGSPVNPVRFKSIKIFGHTIKF